MALGLPEGRKEGRATGKHPPSSFLCKVMGAGTSSPQHPRLMSLEATEGLHPRGALSTAPLLPPTTSLHPCTKQPLGQLEQPTPACSTREGAQMGAVGLAKPKESHNLQWHIPWTHCLLLSPSPQMWGLLQSQAVSQREAHRQGFKSRCHPQRAPVQSVVGCGAAPEPGVSPGGGFLTCARSRAASSVPFLRRPLYTARGGNVAKSSPGMKRKWQPKGPFPGPPRCLSQAEGSPQPPVTLLSRDVPAHGALGVHPGVHCQSCSDAPQGSPAGGLQIVPRPSVDVGIPFKAPLCAAVPPGQQELSEAMASGR